MAEPIAKRIACFALLVGLLLSIAQPASAVVTVSERGGRVLVDPARAIGPLATENVTKRITELNNRSGADFVVLLIPTTNGGEITQYAQDMFSKWSMSSHGILAVLATDDQRTAMVVGADLQDTIPPGQRRSISENAVMPPLIAGNLVQAVARYVDAVRFEFGIAADSSTDIATIHQNWWITLALAILPWLFIGPVLVFVVLAALWARKRNREWISPPKPEAPGRPTWLDDEGSVDAR